MLEAGGRAASHRLSPELCRDVYLPSSPNGSTVLFSPHSRPLCLYVMDCLVLSFLILAARSATTSLILCSFCPSSFHFSHISLLSHKEAWLLQLLPTIEIAFLDQQARPPTSFWVQPQGHRPLLAAFIPNFSVERPSAWHRCFSHTPLILFYLPSFRNLESLQAWGFPVLRGRNRSYLWASSDQPILFAAVVLPSKEPLGYCGLLELCGEQMR